MNQELVLYTNPTSRGRIIRWILEEIGVPYRTEVLEYGPAMKTEQYLSINPMGKVPALAYGSVVVTETAAICAFLADAFPEAGLAPSSLDDRGSYYRWLFFAAGPLEAAITNKSLGIDVPSERQGSVGYGNLGLVLKTLEHAITGNPFIAGSRFSAADIYVGSQIGWGMKFGILEKRPAFEAYWSKLSDREAFRRATQLDDALLKG
jgi:glutathione S-transferase